MKGNTLKSLLISVICGFYAFGATAAVSLFSDYGQIQNVQNYSSNPFWSPSAPYNQRVPQPVYATGADLNSEDCQKVVQSLVAAQCMARDNCKNTDVSDIRPTIMVQLSNLPGHNYVSACSGYIDGIFESYVQQYGNTLPNRPTAFPNATTPTLNDSGGIQFNNPYKKQPTDWQKEQTERAKELEALQKQNGTGNERLTKTNFPATYADLSFSERMENNREGLMPYKDAVAYKTLNVKTAEEWCDEHPTLPECKKKNEDNDDQGDDDHDIDDDDYELNYGSIDFVYFHFERQVNSIEGFKQNDRFCAVWRTSTESGNLCNTENSSTNESMSDFFDNHLNEATKPFPYEDTYGIGEWQVVLYDTNNNIKMHALGESSCSINKNTVPQKPYETDGNMCWCRVAEIEFCKKIPCKSENMDIEKTTTNWLVVHGTGIEEYNRGKFPSCSDECAKRCIHYFLNGQTDLFYFPQGVDY